MKSTLKKYLLKSYRKNKTGTFLLAHGVYFCASYRLRNCMGYWVHKTFYRWSGTACHRDRSTGLLKAPH